MLFLFLQAKMSTGRVPNGDFYKDLVDLTLKSDELDPDKQKEEQRHHPKVDDKTNQVGHYD